MEDHVMEIRNLKYALVSACGLLAVAANAATPERAANRPFADADHVIYSPLRGAAHLPLKSNLTNHGGGVIATAKVVLIFWGPSFNNAASPDYAYARTLESFRDQFGSSQEYSVLQEYGVNPASLGSGTADKFDTSAPPANVTDAKVQAEVNRYLSGHAFNSSTVYEVVIPSTSYSSSGGSDSCGGPSLAYCSYHGSYSGTPGTVIYSIQPYPSCSGCQVSGFTNAQDEELFVGKETCDAVTDPVNAWWDSATGEEVTDKCSWSPPPYLLGGYAYQYIWSNKAGACVK
jgi:hypothetical protein